MEGETAIATTTADYPWSKAFFVASCLWVVAVFLLPSRFAIVLLIGALPLNLILQRILIHPARRWPIMSRRWVRTATISVLAFAVPLHFVAWSQRTANARFRQLVLNPIPADVSDISKNEAMGIDGWIAINFTVTPEVAVAIIRSRPFRKKSELFKEPTDHLQPIDQPGIGRLQFQAAGINISTAEHYVVWDNGESFHFIVSADGKRACFIYERL